MEKLMFPVPSSDGIHTLAGVVYLPSGEARGIFHAVHGMIEHIGRYEPLMRDMATAGYIAVGYDNLGHGRTARTDGELGYIAKKDGYDLLARDVRVFADAVRAAYDPAGHLPYYLMGHSMGSFITRYAVERYIRPDKYIIMGTGGKNPAAGAGLALAALIRFIFGERHISPLLKKMAFGAYNRRFGGNDPDDPDRWTTADETQRAIRYADKFCTFHFTVSAMCDLVRLNKLTSRTAWYQSIPKDLPILLISGEEDPVGDYGRGVREVEKKLCRAGVSVTCILYPAGRHEILNDTTYEQTKKDILLFLEE